MSKLPSLSFSFLFFSLLKEKFQHQSKDVPEDFLSFGPPPTQMNTQLRTETYTSIATNSKDGFPA